MTDTNPDEQELREKLKHLRLYEDIYGSHLELDDDSVDQIMQLIHAHYIPRTTVEEAITEARIDEIRQTLPFGENSKLAQDRIAELRQRLHGGKE